MARGPNDEAAGAGGVGGVAAGDPAATAANPKGSAATGGPPAAKCVGPQYGGPP